MAHIVICGKEVIYSRKSRDPCPCKGNWPYSGLQRNTGHPADTTRCADCHIVTDKWFCSASFKDMIPRQMGAGSLSASSIDQCSVLEEGQHGADMGTHAYFMAFLCEREAGSPTETCRNWERKELMDCVGNIVTRCSEEGAWCFPCCVLCCECLVSLETAEAWSFLRLGPVLLPVTEMEESAYVVFSPATQWPCSAAKKLQQLWCFLDHERWQNEQINSYYYTSRSNLNQKSQRQAFLNRTWYKMGLIWFRIRFITVPYLQGCPETNQKPSPSRFRSRGCKSQVQKQYFRKTHLVFTGGWGCLNSFANLSLKCFWKTCLMSHRGSQRNQEMILQCFGIAGCFSRLI